MVEYTFSCGLFWKFIIIYWKIIFLILWPIITLPVFVLNDRSEYRCIYVVLILAGYWSTEALPLPVTSLLPMVLFPMLKVMSAKDTASVYINNSSMIFIAGIFIAITLEFSGLHLRVALHFIKCVGCSHRRLNFGLFTMTVLVSMWIVNTAAAAMMLPIIQATLQELEDNGFGTIFVLTDEEEAQRAANPATFKPPRLSAQEREESDRRPTNLTMSYYIGTAYAATLGGIGTLVGTGTNLIGTGSLITEFPKSREVSFNEWFVIFFPIMLMGASLTWIYLQIWYVGLFRPNSADARAAHIPKEGIEVIKGVIDRRIEDLGPITFHEVAVAVLFVSAVVLWVLRDPRVFKGWSEVLSDGKGSDATCALLIIWLFFMLPAKPNFWLAFSKDPEERPTKASTALVNWGYLSKNMAWGLLLLLGGGFTISKASTKSKASEMIADALESICGHNRLLTLFYTVATTSFLTQFAANIPVANVLLPVVISVSKKIKLDPRYLALATTVCASFAYCLPVSTPPNALAIVPCNMSTWEMIKVGIPITIISMISLMLIFPFTSEIPFNLNEYPSWAQPNATQSS